MTEYNDFSNDRDPLKLIKGVPGVICFGESLSLVTSGNTDLNRVTVYHAYMFTAVYYFPSPLHCFQSTLLVVPCYVGRLANCRRVITEAPTS